MFCVPSGAVPDIFSVRVFAATRRCFLTGSDNTKDGCAAAFRQTASGLGSIVSRIGGLMSPLVNMLGMYHPSIPTVIFSTLSITSGGLCFLLPETRRKELPESILEAENNG